MREVSAYLPRDAKHLEHPPGQKKLEPLLSEYRAAAAAEPQGASIVAEQPNGACERCRQLHCSQKAQPQRPGSARSRIDGIIMVLGVSRCKIAFVVLICAGVLAGCGGGEEQTGDLDQIVGLESDTEDLEARIAELEEEVIEKDRQLAEIAEAAEELEANSTALTDAVAGVANASRSLGFEDWQFAVPRVMDKVKIVATAAADVETATQNVKEASEGPMGSSF